MCVWRGLDLCDGMCGLDLFWCYARAYYNTPLLYFLISEVNKMDQQPGLFQQLFPTTYYYFCNSDVTFDVNSSNVKVHMWNARIYPFSNPEGARSKFVTVMGYVLC